MNYFNDSEKQAIEMLAARIRGSFLGEFMNWTSEEILQPNQKRFTVNYDRFVYQPNLIPGVPSVEYLDEIERFKSYREMLSSYDPFIEINGFGIDLPTEITTAWMRNLEDNVGGLDFELLRGWGWRNYMEGSKRAIKPVGLILVRSKAIGIRAELMDSSEIDNEEPAAMKILFIHSPGRVAPYSVRRFVAKLKELIIDRSDYQICYGHAADCDQGPNYKHNALGADKRFKKYGTMELEIEEKTVQFEVSRLTRYWGLQGFDIFPSPENTGLAVGFYSAEFRDYLNEKNPELWGEVVRTNHN